MSVRCANRMIPAMFPLKDKDLRGFVSVFEARGGSCYKKLLMYIYTPPGSTDNRSDLRKSIWSGQAAEGFGGEF